MTILELLSEIENQTPTQAMANARTDVPKLTKALREAISELQIISTNESNFNAQTISTVCLKDIESILRGEI